MALGGRLHLVCDGTLRSIWAAFLAPWQAEYLTQPTVAKVLPHPRGAHFQTRRAGGDVGLVARGRVLREARETASPLSRSLIGGEASVSSEDERLRLCAKETKPYLNA